MCMAFNLLPYKKNELRTYGDEPTRCVSAFGRNEVWIAGTQEREREERAKKRYMVDVRGETKRGNEIASGSKTLCITVGIPV